MTFTEAEQKEHRKAFIEECRQKAWGAACHADFISKNLDDVIVRFEQMQEDDRKLEAEIKALAGAIDSHTVENRNKRKALQEKRDNLTQAVQAVAKNAQEGSQGLQQLLQSVEATLALAKHAETWEWKETVTP